MAINLVLFATGCVLAADASYLLLLAVAALWHRVARQHRAPTSRLVVLVPAYNEEDYIARCVASLASQDYRPDLYSIVVIADNCTDDTATIAATAGAEVIERQQPDARGKGQALRWAMDLVLARSPEPDAVVVVDADSIADRQLLSCLAARLETGSDAVQGDYGVLQEDRSARADLRSAALLLFHRVRFGGRAVLHLPCNLVGNGMLFSRDLLERHPWDAFTGAEDLEYSIGLRLAGVRPVFASDAQLRGPVPAGGRALRMQQRRWTGGRLYIVRTQLPRLFVAMLRQRDLSLFDAVVDLATPPLGLLSAAIAVGTMGCLVLVAIGAMPWWPFIPWALASLAVPAFVLVGFRAAHCPASTYRSLAAAPFLVASQLLGYIPLLKGLRPDAWDRTERPSEVP